MTRITKRSSCIAVAVLLIADALTIGSALGQQPEQTPMEGSDGQSAYAFLGDRERGRHLAEACAACHGADGNSSDPKYPSLLLVGRKRPRWRTVVGQREDAAETAEATLACVPVYTAESRGNRALGETCLMRPRHNVTPLANFRLMRINVAEPPPS
jgi:mono/diheme cytochrome c family protein